MKFIPWMTLWPIAVLFLLLLLWRVLAQFRAVGWVLRTLKARQVLPDSQWSYTEERAADLAYQHRLARPTFYVLPEFSPNGLSLRGRGGSIHLVLSEGLLQVLTQKELDAVLLLLLAQASFRDAAKAARLSYFLAPFCFVLDLLPRIFWFLISPILSGMARMIMRPSRIYKSDRRAVQWAHGPELAQALQKLSSLLKKLPMRHWNLAFDHLFILSPMQIEASGIPFVTTHPPMPTRLRRLVELGLGSKA